jgi:hypothetical protein
VARYQCLTFLTDYGLEDGFVASCHGVAARIAPQLPVIDITHLVPPGDVRRGAAVLAQTMPFMPSSVHVAVVDPGVGTARRGIAVQAGEAIFVGPDNGVLSWAIQAAGGAVRAFSLTNSEFWLHPVSATFHGRDIFAPVAARLAAGAAIAEAGQPCDPDHLVVPELPEPRLEHGALVVHALYVDRFGNIQLDAGHDDLASAGLKLGRTVELHRDDRESRPAQFARTFAEVERGALLLYEDAYQRLALAVSHGDAAGLLGIGVGEELRLVVRAG